ncbi:relaxase/mobilization nuclease domain-containing protein [Alistipes putredinis]|uniref:relaxase/mobilization nuclease domain-containing protein n=1 Tax=Alistipes putredinis TaxID=28117 RepID=UPI003AAF681A
MVPKVNSGANVYGVLQYNRIKVEAGEGRILYMQGIPERSDGRFSIEECAEAFGYYTALNPRVRKPVVHFSLNPSPEDRLSEAQLTRLAAEFMERMGYGRQPYVVFLHEDIARRHMHVVSVRVDEQGRKIDHNNELRRAMAVCRELEYEYGLHVPEDGGVQTEPEELHRVDYLRSDLKHQLRNVVMTLKQQYGFQSLAEFNTLLERYGVAAEEIRGDVQGRPYRGLVYHVLDDDGQRTGAAVKASRLGDFFGWKALEEKFDASKQRLRQHPETLDRTRREIDRARSGSRNRKEFTAELRKTVSTQFSGRTMPGGFTESLSSTARHIRCSTAPGSERSMRPTLSRRGSTVGSKSRPHPYRKSYGRWHPSNRPSRDYLRSKSSRSTSRPTTFRCPT